MKNFFISYNHEDEHWAEWIAFNLEANAFSTVIQAWDFPAGANFVYEMHRATSECERTIAVLSPEYLASLFTQAEWAVAFSTDPVGINRALIPVRVRLCRPGGLLKTVKYCDLVGLSEKDAKTALLKAIERTRVKREVPFPGKTSEVGGRQNTVATEYVSGGFPGPHSTVYLSDLDDLSKAALDLLNIVRTTGATFDAQARLRDRLVQRVSERLILNPYLDFAEFFSRYFSEFDNYERQLFATIRSYTETVLFEHNSRALGIIRERPDLSARIPHLSDLELHLTIWISKYQGTFLEHPEMCLIYVGVDEQVPFPSSIASELWSYLHQQRVIDALLRTEPRPPEFEERSSGDWYWKYLLEKKWRTKRLKELDTEQQEIRHRDKTDSSGKAQRQRLREIDKEYARLLANALVPGLVNIELFDVEKVSKVLTKLNNSKSAKWPTELLATIEAMHRALAQHFRVG